MTKITQTVGYVFIATAILFGVLNILGGDESQFALGGLVSICILQFLMGLFLVYASIQKQNNTLLSDKVYPASIAATILYLAFAYRWFWYGA